MKTTEAYGVRGSNVHETGHKAVPLPVWGRQDTQGMARAAARRVEDLNLEEMIKDFIEAFAMLPRTLHVTAKAGSLKMLGRQYRDLGYVSFNIVYGADANYFTGT